MSTVLIYVIRIYKIILSPILPFNHCRFFPSCSDYAIEAVTRYGAGKGSWLAVKRVGRCHPFHKGHGYDPVP